MGIDHAQPGGDGLYIAMLRIGGGVELRVVENARIGAGLASMMRFGSDEECKSPEFDGFRLGDRFWPRGESTQRRQAKYRASRPFSRGVSPARTYCAAAPRIASACVG